MLLTNASNISAGSTAAVTALPVHWAAEPTALTCLALAAHGEPTGACAILPGNSLRLNSPAVPSPPTANRIPPPGPRAWQSWPGSPVRSGHWDSFQHQPRACPRLGTRHPRTHGTQESSDWPRPHDRWLVVGRGDPLLDGTDRDVCDRTQSRGACDHVRTRDGVRLVTDRLLPQGGSNYGSTIVLGQATLPQVESTGLAHAGTGR